MSDLKATVQPTANGFQVTGHESINYGTSSLLPLSHFLHHRPPDISASPPGFQFVDNIFDPASDHLATLFRPWTRVLLVSDATVSSHYAPRWEAYFRHHGIALTAFVMAGGEKNKTMETMLSVVDAMNAFGLVRKEPVLVVGGGYVFIVVSTS